MDKKLVPGTGTPVDDGFTLEEVKSMFQLLFSSNLIVSMDFVEYNPLLDEHNKTGDICMELMMHLGNIMS